jgi:hypothetical protein
MNHLFSIPGFRTAISLLVCVVFLVHLTSCGTIMYPERRGMPRNAAQIDVKVVVMDGALLLLFVLPGLIAYAVDFSTGCIYLPPGRIMKNFGDLAPSDMRVIRAAPEQLNIETLPGIIEQYTGVSIAPYSDDVQIFRPDSADINIQQELALLFHGEAPQSQGTWYTGEQIAIIADADGRATDVGIIVPMEARLAGE